MISPRILLDYINRGFVCVDLSMAEIPCMTTVSHYILIYDTLNWNLKPPIKEQPANKQYSSG